MKRFQSRWLAAGALVAALTVSLVAAARLSSTGASSAGFKAKGPGGLNIEGKTSELTVSDDGTTVTVTVPLGNIDTGMSLRNTHTKEDIECTTYPNAELKVARRDLKFPAAGAESSGDAKGKLTLHGQTKDVTFHYTAGVAGDTLSVKGSTMINVSDFGIKPRTYFGVGIKPDVEISATFQAKDN